MINCLTALLMLISMAGTPTTPLGTIQGVVVNGTRAGEPLANAEVILRVGRDNSLLPIAKTRTDASGTFIFEALPIDASNTFSPGAERNGVYYPGGRHRLDADHRSSQSQIVVFDSVELSPLVVGTHELEIVVHHDFLEATERVEIVNPSRTTYVGARINDKLPTTLALSIPPNFDRVTFDNEFYGRRFQIVEHQLVTDIPWPPGNRELRFTYKVPLEKSSGIFRRRVDLPSDDVRVRVRADNSQRISCNLTGSMIPDKNATIEANAKNLAAGFTIEVRVGDVPVDWMRYARWSSLGILGALAFGSVAVHRWRVA